MRLILLFWGFLITSCTMNVSMDSKSNDEEAIREVRAASNEAIKAHDTVAIADAWVEDFLVLSSGNDMAHGKEENRKLFASLFRSRPDVIYVRTPLDIQVMKEWGMASETGTWEGSWTGDDGKIEIGGTYYAKWHKVNEHWLIRAEVFTPTHCSGGAFCNTQPLNK